jgi:hypothetical protein
VRARRAIHTDSSANGYTVPDGYSLTFPFGFTDANTDADTLADPDSHASSVHAYREFQRRLRARRRARLGREHGY